MIAYTIKLILILLLNNANLDVPLCQSPNRKHSVPIKTLLRLTTSKACKIFQQIQYIKVNLSAFVQRHVELDKNLTAFLSAAYIFILKCEKKILQSSNKQRHLAYANNAFGNYVHTLYSVIKNLNNSLNTTFTF